MNEIAPRLDGRGLRIGIVRARFNAAVGERALSACLGRLAELAVSERDIVIVSVPGALEAPLMLRAMATSRMYDALIVLGAVIRGETYHFEVVSNESAAGIARVQLDTGVPVANGILTTENGAQAELRAGTKGRDCAEVAVEMANLLRDLDSEHR